MGGSQALAFGLVAASGAATFLGAIGVLFNKSRLDTSFLSVAMAASAGVMIYVSFVEIFSQKSTGYFVDSGMSEVTSCLLAYLDLEDNQDSFPTLELTPSLSFPSSAA